MAVICVLTCFRVFQAVKSTGLPDSLLAGRYYQGDGLGVNHVLILGTDHRLTFEGHTDVGASEKNQGKWEYDGEVLLLRLDRKSDAHHWTGTSTRFVPICWGDAVTLVEEAATPGFLSIKKQDPAALDSTHSLDYWKLKESSFESIPRNGPIQYPPKYADFVANGPVFATIKAVKPGGTVYISTTTPKRMRVGMLFTTADWSGVDVEITKVDSLGAVGKVCYFVNSTRPLKLGDKHTTGGRHVTPHGRDDERLSAPPQRQ